MEDYKSELERKIRLEMERYFSIGEIGDFTNRSLNPIYHTRNEIEGRLSAYTQLVKCDTLFKHYRECFPDVETFEIFKSIEKIINEERVKIVSLLCMLTEFVQSQRK